MFPDQELCRVGAGTSHSEPDIISEAPCSEAIWPAGEESQPPAVWAAGFGTYRFDNATGKFFWTRELKSKAGTLAVARTEISEAVCRLHPDDEARFLDEAQQCAGHGGEFELEYRILLSDGSIRWLLGKGRPIFDKSSRAACVAGVCVDITALKRSEALLEKSAAESARHSKEINCLYALSKLIEHEDDCATLFRQVVQIIPPAFEQTGGAAASIRFESETFQAGDLACHSHRLREELLVQGTSIGSLDVRYSISVPGIGREVFEEEYRALIRQIAGKLGRAVERKLALEALRESEDRWRAMTSALTEGVVLHDQDGRIVTWNPSAERLLGLSAEQLRGCDSEHPRWRTIREDGSDFPDPEHPAMVTLRTGKPCDNVVMGLQRPDGNLSWISINSRPLFHAGEDLPYAVVASFDDITERRRSDARTSLLAAVAETSPDAIASADLQGCVTSWNSGAEHMYGYRAEEMLGQPITLLMPPDRQHEMVEILGTIRQGKRVTYYDTVRLHKNGSRIDVSIAISPILDPQGMITGAAAVARDVTERKRNEEKMTRLATIVETSSDAMFNVDLDGRILSWNRGAAQLLGYTAEEAVGQPLSLLVPDPLREEMRAVQSRVLQGEVIPHFDTVRRCKNGELVHLSIAITPIYNEAGVVRGAVLVARDITERKRMEAQLQYNAFHDRLTGVPNRSLFMDRLNHVIARAERFGESYAVFVMDMDNFKLINDSAGHLVGDKVLCAFVDRIKQLLRPVDTLARFGGDEFTLLLEETENPETVEEIAQRILEALRPPFLLGGQEITIGSSIGITLGDETYKNADQALRDADVALYEAKRRGKGQYVIFDSRMRGEAVSRLYLESELRRALLETELSVEYQPIVDLQTDRIVGCEALVRWCHSIMGLVEPSRFINVAEDTGLITPLGRFVLERSCQALAEWLKHPKVPNDFYISVNISPKEFYAGDLVPFVRGLLQRSRLAGCNIRLEITENVVIQHDREATAILLALQEMGVQVCMDDFGTGYSSLSYLHQLPFNVIKVDRSFVQRLAEKKQSREIVRSVLGLAQALDMQSIAEGAETQEQLDQVKALGFRWAQGFVLHRPMGRKALRKLLVAY